MFIYKEFLQSSTL